MPSMTDHESAQIVKVLFAADSSSGKSGSLAPLVDAGLNVRVLDYDNGLSILRGYVKDKSKLANVHYQTLQDKLKLTANRIGVQKASAFQRGMDMLEGKPNAWGEGLTFPPVTDWTPKEVLVIDSFSMMGRSALQMVMQLANKGFDSPELQHYGLAMENLERLIGIVTSSEVKCHVIVNTHLVTPEGSMQTHPEALGSKLGPKLGRYFDNLITASRRAGKHTFKTQKDGLLQCKTAVPMAAEFPIETGLLDIFKKLTGKSDLLAGL